MDYRNHIIIEQPFCDVGQGACRVAGIILQALGVHLTGIEDLRDYSRCSGNDMVTTDNISVMDLMMRDP